MNIMNKGFIFTTDLLLTVIIVLVMLLVFVIFLNNQTQLFVQKEKYNYLEEKTIFVADSFVKNYSEENSMLGACIFDEQKKRVLSNEISSINFLNIKQINLDDFFIKEITISNITTKKIFYDAKISNNCFGIKRFALIDGIKSKIYFLGCLI